MSLLIDDNIYVKGQPIKQFLQNKIDNLATGATFTLANLCELELEGEDLSHLGVVFKHLVETNQLGHIEFVKNRSDGVAVYKKTEINTPFTRVVRVGQ